MRLQYIQSSTIVIESNGVRVLCDPWLSDGIYHGSWFHYPPLKYGPGDFADVDYIYISHIHPDHFDVVSLAEFPRQIPIIILDYAEKFLRRSLEKLGFTEIIELASEQTLELGPDFQLEIFASHFCDPSLCGKMFVCDQWLDASKRSVGLDSIGVFSDADQVIVNHNDAPYFPMLCDLIASKYPRVDMNLGVYAGAGPYPQCFSNLSPEEVLIEADRKKLQFMQMLERYARHLQSRYVFPFAGQYVLGGKLAHLNDSRGVPDIAEVGEYLQEAKRNPEMVSTLTTPEKRLTVSADPHRSLIAEPVLFSSGNQGAYFDLTTGKRSEPYVPEDRDEASAYIRDVLQPKLLEYEDDWHIDPRLQTNLVPLLRGAARHMRESLSSRPEMAGATGKWNVYLDLDQGYLYDIGLVTDEVQTIEHGQEAEPFVRVSLDYSLLMMLLTRHAHWNNAEIGSHLTFHRSPDIFEPTVYKALAYFHL